MRPVLSDKVAVIGSSQARVLAGWGNAGKVEVVGIPRIDKLAKSWRDSQGHQPLKENAPLRILVATAKTPGFTPEQIETTTRSLSDLKSFVDSQPEFDGRKLEVTWRLTAGLDSKIGVENSLSDLSGMELRDAIAKCDAFITTPSTSMLESMLQHKPTALLDYHECPDYVPAAWKILRPNRSLRFCDNLLIRNQNAFSTKMRFWLTHYKSLNRQPIASSS